MVDGEGRTVSEEHVVVESVFPEVVLVETVGYVVRKKPSDSQWKRNIILMFHNIIRKYGFMKDHIFASENSLSF